MRILCCSVIKLFIVCLNYYVSLMSKNLIEQDRRVVKVGVELLQVYCVYIQVFVYRKLIYFGCKVVIVFLNNIINDKLIGVFFV